MPKSVITLAGSSISMGYTKESTENRPSSTTSRAHGEIKGLSKRARNNLIRTINRLPSLPTRFVVLNFPPTTDIDKLSVARAIKLIGQRLNRRFPKRATLWRLEFTKKGIPHVHLMGDFEFVADTTLRDWIFSAWREILSLNTTSPRNIVYVKTIPDVEQPLAIRYFCKDKKNSRIGTKRYCEQHGSTGRCSGLFNRSKANLSPIVRHHATESQRKRIESLLVHSLEQRIVDINPEQNVMARNAFIDRVASGKDTCLHFQDAEIIEKVRTILADVA